MADLLSDRVVRDLDHARQILKDTVDVKWGENIKHSEPQVIVACAMVVHELAESMEKLTGSISGMEAYIEDVESRYRP